MTKLPYTPQPGTLAWRVCNWYGMSRNRGEERSAIELAQQFEVKRPALIDDLSEAVKAGLLAWEQCTTGYAYKAGPALDAWVRGQSAPAAAAQPPKKRTGAGGARKRLPPLDLSKITVKADVPLPGGESGATGSRWQTLLEKLDAPGKSVQLPAAYRGSFSKAANDWAKAKNVKFKTRAVSADEFGCWRVA